MSPFDAVSGDEIRMAQVVTGVTMAAFLAAGVVPGMRQHARAIRGALLGLYLAACLIFVGYVLVR
jgi:hypothetical protein